MRRFVVIVLDGFGMGAMKDAREVRPGDEAASTLGSILKDFPDSYFPNLERLGLMNAFGSESRRMKFSASANAGRAELMHWGADTFMGHQEIMGTLPKKPVAQPFQEKIEEIRRHLLQTGHEAEVRETKGLRYLLVDRFVTVADNIDADYGMAYNCTAPLDFISFEEEMEIGRRVREAATVNRVIPFGGTGTTLADILAAEEIREGKYIGIHAVKSGSYRQGYQCRHLGYGVDPNVQVPTLLSRAGIAVTLLGKVADIVANDKGKSISCVPTEEVLDLTIEELAHRKEAFICTNVQETDLAGHSQDADWYRRLDPFGAGRQKDRADAAAFRRGRYSGGHGRSWKRSGYRSQQAYAGKRAASGLEEGKGRSESWPAHLSVRCGRHGMRLFWRRAPAEWKIFSGVSVSRLFRETNQRENAFGNRVRRRFSTPQAVLGTGVKPRSKSKTLI